MTNAIAFGRADNMLSATGGVEAVTCVGTTRAGSPTLPSALNVLTTSAGQVAATLPTRFAPMSPILVRNNTATAATIFPPSGGSINGGSADAAFSVAQNKPTVFYALPNGIDYIAVLSA